MKHTTFVLCLDLEGEVFDLFNLISHAAPRTKYFLLVLSELVRSCDPTFAEKLVRVVGYLFGVGLEQ
jgi:hypothetical protein